jgi:hypothetical protein
MKSFTILIFTIPTLAFGQGYPMTGAERAEYYRGRGLSMVMPPAPRTPYPMSGISPESEKFKSIFALVLKAYPNLTELEFLANLQKGVKYSVTKTDPAATCKACNGVGRIPDAKSTEKDKKSKCQSCNGAGKTSPQTNFAICWK